MAKRQGSEENAHSSCSLAESAVGHDGTKGITGWESNKLESAVQHLNDR